MDCVTYYYTQQAVGTPSSVVQRVVGVPPESASPSLRITAVDPLEETVFKVTGEALDGTHLKPFTQVLSFEKRIHPTGERWELNGDVLFWPQGKRWKPKH